MTKSLKITITANPVSPSSFKDDNLSPMAMDPFKTTSEIEESKTYSEDDPTLNNVTPETSEAEGAAVSPVAIKNKDEKPSVDITSPSMDAGEGATATLQINTKETLASPANVVSPTAPNPPASTTPSSAAAKGGSSSSAIVKSLDNTQEVAVSSDLDEAKTPDSRGGAMADDDGDSSNDDSSYFADPSNLPSPKSGGRRYSFSSNHSAPAPTSGHHASSSGNARESDASLSLSDSDDEENHHSDSGLYPAPRGTPDVYPHRIMRVHSVGSLISTSSQNSSEDPVIHDELNQAAAGRDFGNSGQGEIATGRLSPVQAGHLSFASPTSQMAQPSPPTIMPYQYQYQQNYVHPRAQSAMTSSEDWIAAMASQQPQYTSMHTTGSGWSEGTLNYSDDGDMHAFHNNMGSQNSGSAGGPPNSSLDRNSSRSNQPSNRSNGGGPRSMPPKTLTSSSHADSGIPDEGDDEGDGSYRVYWQRWIMLLYMSVLNLLSDWTCYSVAPIALLTQQAFGNINPEELVVVFLGANAVSTACEPIILSRLGLRRTVLFGALLLMIGSIVKSGGMPPIIQAELEKGSGEWRVYLGFFLVGLSQPLYQCTPALLSASWFPEKERTMATGVALNANQLGIGFAFVFGTLLVAESDDIPGYFGLLSLISTITFFGALFQFDDAPPTPPSQTARIVRGDLDLRLPSVRQVLESIGISGRSDVQRDINAALAETNNTRGSASGSAPAAGSSRSKSSSSSGRPKTAPAPSAAPWDDMVASAPSPVVPGSVGNGAGTGNEEKDEGDEQGQQPPLPGVAPYPGYGQPPYYGAVPPPPPQIGYPMYPGMPYNLNMQGAPYGDNPQGHTQYGSTQQVNPPYGAPPYAGSQGNTQFGQEGGMAPPYVFPPPGYPPYPMPVFDPRTGQYVYPPPPPPQYYAPPHAQGDPFGYQNLGGPAGPYGMVPTAFLDEGAEPVVTVTPHHLDIDIRDDQVLLSIRACYARPGFIHALVSFTVSGIVINTLSTFMDYLVRLNGAGREMTGIVGGTFQFVIMISSLIIGGMTDRSRAYYSVTVGMLVLGAFGLAECGVSLNADRGGDLRFALVIVALLVGPLQPVSTELGVEVVYPLSENTVLVIQQLFSNLLSALFIPCFKKMKDIGINQYDPSVQQPEYTFSFYLLIVLHAAATVFFATFNGRYLRYEHELMKKEEQERKEEERNLRRSFSNASEKQPLMQHPLV